MGETAPAIAPLYIPTTPPNPPNHPIPPDITYQQ